jgi:hypothetical protein
MKCIDCPRPRSGQSKRCNSCAHERKTKRDRENARTARAYPSRISPKRRERAQALITIGATRLAVQRETGLTYTQVCGLFERFSQAP